jgi:putative addiction module component (TIGR02574 family)
MIVEQLPSIRNLSRPEKLLLVAELWEEIASEDSDLPITREQIAELDRRMERYRQHPEEVTTLEEIKARIFARKQDT